ncbi:glucan endo-1,3-beta-glucosidase-like [Mangifera indica]|uniref:glucan endo-1,3-beta-glucosidase-like n=1 Tax=Mangifera indica TaxID=29780 RepID=UPI001CFAC3DA|nr:glucan endo-1,3-beta-glucosidase-like [Mangifera indica]
MMRMRLQWNNLMLVAAIVAALLTCSFGQGDIGVNYGLNGDNLPPPAEVVAMFQRCKIPYMRIFEPKHEVLDALKGTEIILSLGTRNEDIQSLAQSPEAATAWVIAHVQPYANSVKIGWITVGNEVIPGPFAPFVGQAITNVRTALASVGLPPIPVTTVVAMTALSVSYPPSAGAFSNDSLDAMRSIVQSLASAGSQKPTPLMINVYPYFAYASNPVDISLDYAMFKGATPVVDGELKYFSLFDAMVDSFYAALEKINASNVPLIIGETGWPSAGNEPKTNKENAHMYNQNLIVHIKGNGTPRKPGQLLTAFFFAMFNENLKAPGVEQNFGLFTPQKQPVYPLLNC